MIDAFWGRAISIQWERIVINKQADVYLDGEISEITGCKKVGDRYHL